MLGLGPSIHGLPWRSKKVVDGRDKPGHDDGYWDEALSEAEIDRGGLAALHRHFIADLLAVIEALQPGLLHGRDMNEHILAAILRNDETETFGGIEPLHS